MWHDADRAGPKGTNTPEQTRAVIEAWVPQELWTDFNLLLVGLGQEVQTERPKLLGKVQRCSDVEAGMAYVRVLLLALSCMVCERTVTVSQRVRIHFD
jgi:hypothetical protein